MMLQGFVYSLSLIVSAGEAQLSAIEDPHALACFAHLADLVSVQNSPAAPVAPPETKPDTKPAPAPTRPDPAPSQPTRPSFPHPRPGHPIKPRPTEAPKDLIPHKLFEDDKSLMGFWAALPENARKLMLASVEKEYQDLQARGMGSPVVLAYSLLKETTQLEQGHEAEIEAVIHKLVSEIYGADVLEHFTEIRLGETRDRPDVERPWQIQEPAGPKPKKRKWTLPWTSSKENKMPAADELAEKIEKSVDQSYLKESIFRRELFNNLIQAQGWNGMLAFIHFYADDLNKIVPGLAEKYQKMHYAFRLGTHMLVRGPMFNSPEDFLGKRKSISQGRESVRTDWAETEDAETGEPRLELKSKSAWATAPNGWALAHEVTKSAFHLKTAGESARESVMSAEERKLLDHATSSEPAEIRQGLFGAVLEAHLKKVAGLMLTDSSTQADTKQSALQFNRAYFEFIERVWTLADDQAFHRFVDMAFHPQILTDSNRQKELKQFLMEYQAL